MSRLRHRSIFAVFVTMTLALLLIAGTRTSWAAPDSPLEDLAGPLRALALAATSGQALPLTFPLPLKGAENRVQVVVQFQDEIGAANTLLETYGAQVQLRRGNRVQASLPARSLLAVAALPQVAQVRPPVPVVRLQGLGANVTEGVQLTGAISFQAAGVSGGGANVAIVDDGFASYASAELPANVTTVSFRADYTMGAGDHGTACAEIIADMAPQANLTLIAADTEMAMETAAQYVRNQGFDVCSCSLGTFGGPYNGTSALSQEVTRARAAGVFWVNAAGNHAERHYEGQFTDADHDNIHEFGGGDETLDVYLYPGQFQAYLSWYQTTPSGLTNHDFDLVLVDAAEAEVARSGYSQNGDDPPADVLLASIAVEGQYGLRIEYYSGPDNPNDFFQLFLPDVDVETTHRVAASSLVIPAEADGSYTVGATRGALDPNAVVMLPIDGLEPFSSQGPPVGRPSTIKPDLTGPDAVTTSLGAAGYSPFYGTSAAAPHVAGAAALIVSEDQLRTADEIREVLERLAVDLGDPGPDNMYGVGRLRLRVGADSRPPTITIAFPRNGETITTTLPTLTAFIQDDGSGVDPATITIELDGVIVFDAAQAGTDITEYYDESTGRLTWTVEQSLARTNHTIIVDCADRTGNVAASGVTNFRVSAPTIPAGVHIVSFPYRDLVQTDPSVILGTPLSDLAMVRWWPLDDAYDKYHFYPDTRASLVPPDCTQANLDDRTVPYPPAGLGYFLSLPQQAILEIQGQTLDDIPSTHIRLYYGQQRPRGWNLIGNPYGEPISWGTVQFVTGGVRQDLREAIAAGVTEGVLFEYVPSGGGPYDFTPDPAAAMLQPMTGYWLHVNQDTRVVIYGGGVATASAGGTVAAQGEGWLLRLCAQAAGYRDPTNFIGVNSTASAGYDSSHDVPEPPPLVGMLQLYMPRAGWGANAGNYAKDVRGTTDDGVWDLQVLCKLPETEVEVNWPELNAQVPAGVKLVLEDLDSGRQVYMRTSSGYRFRTGPDGGLRHLRIRAEEGTGRLLALSAVSAAGAAGGGAVFTYSLSKSAEVGVEVRNIAGRLVKRFAAREVQAGTQQALAWNGVSQLGSPVPAGRYLVVLTARAEDGQTAQAIRPFDVTR